MQTPRRIQKNKKIRLILPQNKVDSPFLVVVLCGARNRGLHHLNLTRLDSTRRKYVTKLFG